MASGRQSGILMHPTSLWGRFGIGDLGKEAYEFVDFLEKSGQSLWQILPLAMPGDGDSPYASSSAFAGNIYLISPELLEEEGLIKIEEPSFPNDKVYYKEVKAFKDKMLDEAYKNFIAEGQREDFDKFSIENEYWLSDFALFSAVKEYYIEKRKDKYSKDSFFAGAVWSTWDKGIRNHMRKSLLEWEELLCDRVEFFKFCQYIFYSQWFSLKEYANKKGIQIIGDMPIFVSYDSADVWAKRGNFLLNEECKQEVGAGVPPDYFSEKGQFWGNPIYNWKYHKQTGYKWWIERIKHNLKCVDILRVDHFRGFESYWEVPMESEDARCGKWVKGPGKDLFVKVKKALGTLPLIAEDLGIITEEVKCLKEEIGLPGMKVLQFAFGDSEDNPYLPYNIERNSVVYTGTHDNDTAISWYNSAPEKVKDHFRRYAGADGKDPSWTLIKLAMGSFAQRAVFPIQDIMNLGTEARMNVPGKSKGNWTFRVKSLSDIEVFAEGLKNITELYGRLPEREEEKETE